jgi:putative transposase
VLFFIELSTPARLFDGVFEAEGVRTLRTPIRAHGANAFAERFVRTVRMECLDHFLIYGRRHLERVLHACVRHSTEQRPHGGLGLTIPLARKRGDQRWPKHCPGEPDRT